MHCVVRFPGENLLFERTPYTDNLIYSLLTSPQRTERRFKTRHSFEATVAKFLSANNIDCALLKKKLYSKTNGELTEEQVESLENALIDVTTLEQKDYVSAGITLSVEFSKTQLSVEEL